MAYIMKHYGAAFIIVLICILISVVCNVQGTMFMQTLIDNYIVPMLRDGNHDFSGLAHAITRVAGFYAIGVATNFVILTDHGKYYTGNIDEVCVTTCLLICRIFQLNILIHMLMVISCLCIRMILIHYDR